MTDRQLRTSADLDRLDFAGLAGLIPVVAQDARDGGLLMVAYATREALDRTLATGQVHFWSRSRKRLWKKGESSGNVLELISLHADCDGDTVLARVRPTGPACHTGEATCFGAVGSPPSDPDAVLAELDATLARRERERPAGSYTVRLLDDENLRLKKLGEETAELVTALAKGDRERAVQEAADVVYHLLTALRGAGVPAAELTEALEQRRR
jgi:phosphoribosyl-ATP pyrophosphohydrolase/phosphoribosyl-AMP cyclohydrolase